MSFQLILNNGFALRVFQQSTKELNSLVIDANIVQLRKLNIRCAIIDEI